MSEPDSKRELLTDSIPDPQTVRDRLGETLREANLLRRLLRIATKAKENRDSRCKSQELANA